MPKKILIVEDEANIRELLRLYLEREGYTVLEAENGVEGIKKWKVGQAGHAAARRDDAGDGRLGGLQGDPRGERCADHHADGQR